jgi:hypothetical protein
MKGDFLKAMFGENDIIVEISEALAPNPLIVSLLMKVII